MPVRFRLIAILLVAFASLSGARIADAQERIDVVASFSILADMTRQIGGDRVNVTALVGPNADAHVFMPSPDAARTVSRARLVIINGLGFEGWMPRLVKSAGGKVNVLVATKGIASRKADHGEGHDHGSSGADPHAWQSVRNAKIYAGNIRDALIGADPAATGTYRANAERYLTELDALDRDVRDTVAAIPEPRRRVISTHDAFGYFADAYGIAFIAPQGVSTDSEASARDVALIIRQTRAAKIPAVFLENVSDPRLIKRIAAETGAKIGGTLYSDALTDEKGDAPTYIGMVRHNIRTLASALRD